MNYAIGAAFIALFIQLYRAMHGKGGPNTGGGASKGGSGMGGGGGMGGMFNSMGKSNVTVYGVDKKIKTRFKHVAGMEQAKVEVMEFVDFLKNPKKYGSDSDFINNTGNCLRYFETDSANDDFIEDELIKTPTGSALAKVFHHDRTSDILYYYQDQETGFSDFSISSTVQDITGVRSCTVLNLVNPPLDIYSGEILYLNNTSSSITREDNQTEDIRIVIELG